jgi:ATP-dependent DNA helicase RecQ
VQAPLDILQRYWKYPAFRPLQEEIIQSVLDENDTLALLPTGGGKSICYQVPALCMDGLCIVVSPLIALMKDQVEQLRDRCIKAYAIHSGMSYREIDITLDNCIYDQTKFLYVSPERLKTPLFKARAQKMDINLLAVDEAHCISQWGYDFRPPYLELAEFKNQLDIRRIIAVTATATKEVKEDILEKLEMKEAEVFQKSFARENLSYAVFKLDNRERKLLEILQNVKGSGVVYVRNRKRTKHVAEFLIRNHISADYYHAGLPAAERSRKQESWIKNNIQIIVATNAFGMGIDKPDVRTVIHLDLPDTLEAYYQEAGRAGRDGKRAYAVMLYNAIDIQDLERNLQRAVVDVEVIRKTYFALNNYYQLAIGSQPQNSLDFDLSRFCTNYSLEVFETYQAIKRLHDEGILQLNDGFAEASRVSIMVSKEDLYRYQVANPKFDLLLKTLLRLYGGSIFSEYIKIKEKELSAVAKMPLDEVIRQLQFLHKNEMIDYQASRENQTILFLIPRIKEKDLPIDEKQLHSRRMLLLDKGKAVVGYLEETGCRSLFLQRYFDENAEIPCGICDNDLLKKRNQPLSMEQLKKRLTTPKSITQLHAELPTHPQKEFIELLRMMIEDGLVIEENGLFRLI